MVHARASQGDGVDGHVVVEIAASESDRPHAVYGFLCGADQEGSYEGEVEDEEEHGFLGHASVHHEGGFCSHQRRQSVTSL